MQEEIFPELIEKIKSMQKIFSKIDQLEQFIMQVDQEVARIEKIMDDYEAYYLFGKPVKNIVNKAFALLVR